MRGDSRPCDGEFLREGRWVASLLGLVREHLHFSADTVRTCLCCSIPVFRTQLTPLRLHLAALTECSLPGFLEESKDNHL